MGDEMAFRDNAERYADELHSGKNAMVANKYQRLMREAQRSGLDVSTLQKRTRPTIVQRDRRRPRRN